MFFDDEISALTLRKRSRLSVPPPIPETGWRPPQYYPNLSAATAISFDVEVKETDWSHGPGWSRGPRGHICGFSVGARDRNGNLGKWYFPVRHELEPDYNLDPNKSFDWLREILQTPNVPKVGANLLYDIGWLTEERINVQGQLFDVQFAEALIDETARTALENIAGKYVGVGKETSALYTWLALAYGGDANDTQRANIFRSPPKLAGPYGEADAELPLRILDAQWPILVSQGLTDLFRMECALIPLLVRMRSQGVRIDVPYCERLYGEIAGDIRQLETQLFEQTGVRANVDSADDVAKVFDAVGIEYPRTDPTKSFPDGRPSFRKEYMKALLHPIADLVNLIREYKKSRGTFLKNYLLEGHVNGIIHCQFHPLRNDDGGAKTGRFSSSDPNLQNIPIRTPVGKKIRKAFVPFADHLDWWKIDYSQIEYRMLAHFATGFTPQEQAAAKALVDAYNNDPSTDYHKLVQDNIVRLINKLIDRRPLKNINFGLIYGQSEKSLAYKAGFTAEEAKVFFPDYHAGSPYVRSTMKAIGDEVQMHGFITTIAGRRCRFDLWEPAGFGMRGTALPYEAALLHYGPQIRRAYEYRGVNYKLQGSAADVIKRAMVAAYESGVMDVIGIPLVQVHDELGFSRIDNSPQQLEAYAYLNHILENTTPCRVPIKTDAKGGNTWGDID
jgi:DNA polymerase-1